MPRYIVQRTVPAGIRSPLTSGGSAACRAMVEQNAEEGVTWLNSFISEDKTHTYCVCDAPTPEAIRRAATRNRLPVDEITQVRVRDPYFYV